MARQCLLFLLVTGDRFAASLRHFDRAWGAGHCRRPAL